MKKRKQSDDDEGRGVQDDKNLNTTGVSSSASWLGDDDDKADFILLSDEFLTSSAIKKQVSVGMEDDYGMKEDDQNVVPDEVNHVLTSLTPPRRGQEDLTKSPGMGQEGGEDDRRVPDNVTSPTTSSGWVEGSTIASGPTTHHEGGGEYDCCVGGSSIARMASLDNRDEVCGQAQMSRQTSRVDDEQTTLFGDRDDDDEGVQDDWRTKRGHGTLTPSIGQPGETGIAVTTTDEAMGPRVHGGPDIAKETDDKVMDRRQRCGFVDNDSKEEDLARGQEDRSVVTMFVESDDMVMLMPSSGTTATTADTGKNTLGTSKNFDCAALSNSALLCMMPGYHGQTQEAEPCQADGFVGAKTTDRTVLGTAMETRDDEPHSTQCMRGPLLSEAGTEPCQPQVLAEDEARNHDFVPNSTAPGDALLSPSCGKLLQDVMEAGTEPGQAGTDQVCNDDDNLVGGGDPGTDGGSKLMTRGRCHHDKDGTCDIHGEGARKLSRKVPCITKNKQGVLIKKMKKVPYFECDLGPRGRGVLRQTTLSFIRTPTTPSRTGGGHDRAGDGILIDFSLTTEGQHGGDSVRATGTEPVGRMMKNDV